MALHKQTMMYTDNSKLWIAVNQNWPSSSLTNHPWNNSDLQTVQSSEYKQQLVMSDPQYNYWYKSAPAENKYIV